MIPVGWLFDVLGVKDFFDSVGTLYPRRQQMRLLGVSIADNATLGTTDVTFGAATVQGATATGAHVYDPDTTALVWNRGAVTAGCFWRIGAHTIRQTIRFTSFHVANILSIHDPTDNVLGSLLYTSGNIYSVECNFDGSSWNVVDQKVKP
jgi:hypothetical protein